MPSSLHNYLVITGSYWAFTLTDGAIRMLVVLYFHQLGYSPFEVAMLFIFYEFFGIITNLVGGWLGARIGLNLTLHLGLGLQVAALLLLTVPDHWLSVGYVMFAQALSGIAKDLNKMSAKASVKILVSDGTNSKLFKWVAVLTGSKNTLKGAGYFAGAILLECLGFRDTLLVLASLLIITLIVSVVLLPQHLGKTPYKAKFSQFKSNIAAINWLSAARFFLFGARDIWFVVALPVFLYDVLGWSFTSVGTFMAIWIIGYGMVQAGTPKILTQNNLGYSPTGKTAKGLALILSLCPVAIAIALQHSGPQEWIIVSGLTLFGILFALNSSVHSYLILAYSEHNKVAMNVGFYYMANAGGRLLGTLLSGWVYQSHGLEGCLWLSSAFILTAAILSFRLP